MHTSNFSDTRLNSRHYEVLSMTARDYRPRSMAAELHVSKSYVYELKSDLFLYFGVSTDGALVAQAIDNGFIAPDGTILVLPPCKPDDNHTLKRSRLGNERDNPWTTI